MQVNSDGKLGDPGAGGQPGENSDSLGGGSTMGGMRSLAVRFVMFATAGACWAACEASNGAIKEIAALGAVNAAEASFHDLLESRWRLAQQYPEDYHVHAFAQVFRVSQRREWDRALEHYRKIGNRDTRELLEARLRFVLDPAQSREQVRGVLARQPELPEAHLVALEMAMTPPQVDLAEGEKHFRELRRLCPASLKRFTYLNAVQDPDLMAASLQEARRLLAGQSDADALRAWRQVIEYLYLAKDPRLGLDVARLRGLNLYDRDDWVQLMMHAYVRTQDTVARVSLLKEVARRRPASSWGIQAAMDGWQRAHPAPLLMNRAGFAEHGRARRAFARSLVEKYPESLSAVGEYLSEALYGQDTSLTDEEAVSVLELVRRYQGDRFVSNPDAALVEAAVYVERRIRLEEVPRLVEEALRESEEAARYELMSEARKTLAEVNLARTRTRARRTLAEYYLLKGERARVGALVAELRGDLAGGKPRREASAQEREAFAESEKAYLELARRVGVAAVPVLAPREIDWERVGRVLLTEFEARDLAGKSWTREELAGKVVLVNLWATWCGPCRAEFPLLQRLHEEGRVVLAVSTDIDPALAQRFVEENGYTMPVIVDRTLADKIDFVMGVPQNRLIDREGRKLVEPVNGSGEEWLSLVRELMDWLGR